MKKKNQNTNSSIKCDVESCKHNNTEEQECELNEIKISCTCDNDDCTCSEETVCDSFESKDDEEEQEIDEEVEDDEEEVEEDSFEVETEEE